jgi:Fur family zinc uptake transcriptional regulator
MVASMQIAEPRQGLNETAAKLETALALCRQRGARLTAMRRQLLEVLLRAGHPLGAYDVKPLLEKTMGRRLAPLTVYRTLNFLLNQGLIARIESRSAFIPRIHPENPHPCAFFVCGQCGDATEVENVALESLIADDAASLGFRINRTVVELEGTCARCLPVAQIHPA